MTTFELSTQVLAAQAGDERAFGLLVERYQNAAASVAMGIVRNAAASQDIAQAAFVAAWGKLKTLRKPESFGPWLLQLVRNEALQSLRANKRSAARDHAFSTAQPAEGPDADALLSERTMYANLYTALEEIPDDCREILLLYYREGRSSDQVGELLSLSGAAVRKRLERAREVLRDRFETIEDAAKKTAPPAGFVLLVLAAMRTKAVAATASVILAPKTIAAISAALVVIVGSVFLWQSPQQTPDTPVVAASSAKKIAARKRSTVTTAGAAVAADQRWIDVDDPAFTRPPLSTLPAFTVSGRVLDDAGAAVTGARVAFSVEEGTKHFVTNVRGEYSGSVPRGAYRVSATAIDRSAARPLLLVNADTADIDFVLAAPARIDGLVRDENGRPLRAHIAISPHEHTGDWLTLEAGEDGTFSAVDLPPGSYDVVARTDDRIERPYEDGVTVAAGGSYFAELSFKAATASRVRVVDDAGAPLSGFDIRIGEHTVAIGEDGVVALDRKLPLGKTRVMIFERGADNEMDLARGFATSRIYWTDSITNDGKPIEIVVNRSGELQLEAQMAAPYLHLSRVESIGGWVETLSRVVPFDAKHTATVRLPAGTYNIVASESYLAHTSRQSMPVKIRAGRTERLTFSTRPSVEHVVKVLEPNGQPARHALLVDDRTSFESDALGVIRGITPRAYPYSARVNVGGRGAVVTITDDKTIETTVTLQPAASVRGVVEGVSPSETIAVTFSGPNEHWFALRTPQHFMGNTFTLDDLGAGDVTITVRTRDGTSGDAKVTVAAGETANVVVKLGSGARINGTLVINNGPPPSPLPLVTIDGRGQVHVGGGEHFTFMHLTPGKHTVQVLVHGSVAAERVVEVAGGETNTLEPIELDATKFIQPRVFQDD